MEDVFALAEFGIKRDRRRVLEVGLNKDDVGAALRSDGLKFADERGGDAAAAVGGTDGEVVEIDLAAFAFELGEFVRGESADDVTRGHRGDRDECRAAEQAFEVGLAGLGGLVGFRFVERFTEEIQGGAEQGGVADAEAVNPKSGLGFSRTATGPEGAGCDGFLFHVGRVKSERGRGGGKEFSPFLGFRGLPENRISGEQELAEIVGQINRIDEPTQRAKG